jgi:RNA polymerase sigma-70 factor (ECF subfamily)
MGYLERVSSGDEHALAAFYDETSTLVYGLAIRMLGSAEDSEEVTLDVYNQVWRKAATFDSSRGSLLSWLVTLTRSRALDRIRARTSRQRNLEPLPTERDLADKASTPEQETALGQERRIVLGALGQLPPEQRRAIELAFFDGLSHSEVAVALNEPLGTVKTRIRLGMMKLRDLLQPRAGASGGFNA